MIVVESSSLGIDGERWLRAVESGEDVAFVRDGRTVARLVPSLAASLSDRTRDRVRQGRLRIPDDFGTFRAEPVPATDGGVVGAVRELIAERDAKR